MKKFSKSLVLLLVLFSTFSLMSCSVKERDTVKDKLIEKFNLDTTEEVVINFYGSLENFPALSGVTDEFAEKFPNCKINYEWKESIETVIVDMLKDETLTKNIHLYMTTKSFFTKMISTDQSFVDTYAYDYYNQDNNIDLSAINAEVTSFDSVNNKLYDIPLYLKARGMVVNTTLLEENGLEIPENWTDFLQCCETLKNAGYIPIQGYHYDVNMALFYPKIASMIINDENYETILKETNEFKPGYGDLFKPIWEQAKVLYENGYYSYKECERIKSDYNPNILNFFENDVAFLPTTTLVYSGMEKREVGYVDETGISSKYNGFDYEFVGCPVGDSPYANLMTESGITINPQANNLNWTKAFVDYLFMENNLQLLAKEKGTISNTLRNSDPRFNKIFEVKKENLSNQAKYNITYFSELKYSFEKMYKFESKVCTDGLIDIEKVCSYYEGKIKTQYDKLNPAK